MSVNPVNSASLQQLLALNLWNGGGNSGSSSEDLASLLGDGDSADISSEGALLSAFGDLPSNVQDKIGLLQSDLSSVDPEELSDDDLKAFLAKLTSDLGKLPGALKAYDPDDMSDADVANARNMLIGMKSLAGELGETGSLIDYTGMSAQQAANYLALTNISNELGSSSSAGLLSLLTSYNPYDTDNQSV